MDHISAAAEALQKAEADLRDIVAKAAIDGDYNSVVQIASWAKSVRDVLEKKSAPHGARPHFALTNGGVSIVAQGKNGRAPAQKVKPTDDYPRFYRKGDELVRIAWSRRARSEYQHKTSEAVLRSLTNTLARLGGKGRIFSTDELLPLRDGQGVEVPAYQLYVCIALFKMTELIEQHGRQGYSIPSPDDFRDAVDAIWRELPSK